MSDERTPLLIRRPSVRDERTIGRRRLACVLILLTELLERLSFYGVVFNLVPFLNQAPLNWTSVHASNAAFTLQTFAFGFCFIAGYLADAKFGRFKVIVFFYLFLIIGYGLMVLLEPHVDHAAALCYVNSSLMKWTELNPAQHRIGNWTPFVPPKDMDKNIEAPCQPPIFIALTCVGLGTAAVRTNIAPFGADQVRSEGPESMRMFFNWLYWSINLGSLLAIFGVTYLEQVKGYFWGFVLTLSVIVLSMLIFLCGSRSYFKKPATGSRIFWNTWKIIVNAFQNRRQQKMLEIENEAHPISPGTGQSTPPTLLPSCPAFPRRSSKPSSFLDYAIIKHGGHFHETVVDDVKFLFKIIIIFASTIPYWTVYFQMTTNYLLQGLHMRISYHHNCSVNISRHCGDFHTPPAWLSAFDVVFTIIFIPIVDRFVYRFLDEKGYPLSLRSRMAIGMVFTILSVVTAGVLEHFRLQIYWEGNVENPCVQYIGGSEYFAADISIFFQIPQYALIGISEVFTSIAGMELAYASAPKSLQSLSMGLFLFFSGIGAAVGTCTMAMFKDVWFFDWDNGDINCRFACPDDETKVCAMCHLDYYFYFLAGFQLFGLVMFIVSSHWLGIGYMCPCSNGATIRSINRGSESSIISSEQGNLPKAHS